jgi:hypothetical protein
MSGDESGDKSGDSRDDEEPEDDESDEDEDDDDDDESDAAVLEWGREPRRLRQFEELRGYFESELKDPSAWTLGQIANLTEGDSLFKAREVVRLWLLHVAELTQSSVGGELHLPRMRLPEVLPEVLPNRRFLSWEEADESFDEACLEERYKRDARLTIQFLFPEAETKGLSAGDKRRIYIIASKVWGMHKSKAMGLLWVMDKEYSDTRAVVGREREWPNLMSEDFMTYAALYPPPIVVCPRH